MSDLTVARPHVELRNIVKRYGDKTVLDNLTLHIGEAEMVALLGPSGCGKSTSLRILAGLENADSGEVLIAGSDVSRKPTRERNMGIVFQAYSLFPHLTARENVAYGLKIRKVKGAERTRRAEELLELVGLHEHMDKYPNQMSGGQQQRVALARSLAIEPDVLLLDEPLSALDAKVRGQLRDEIRRIQLSQGIATLLVTHDQEEAIIMADRVGVMREGRIEQIGTPAQLYSHPQTPFISSFVGIINRIPGIVSGGRIRVLGAELDIVNRDIPFADGDAASALIRPEDIDLTHDDSARFKVMDKQLRGIFTAVMVQDEVLEQPLRIDLPTRAAERFQVGMGVQMFVQRADTVVDHPVDNESVVARTLSQEKSYR
ncbi:ABC transporter ATP-binding protein [Corynebacterium sp.]|uniref:ABC transporter ATP-binding protein n=1 Tax=Corynebacterium sp. TaxID=1720 RepID=UPI0026DFEB41|nr:ABC transporter ATP-binding protein [Corynebacterium sp.]MDO5512538.1 ABC transporter ATP-binding protein [Corynebacterium sp.]